MVRNISAFDPITIDIIQNSLSAISDEMFASMAQAAMSSVIYEVLDFGVAITDANGELASAGAGIPGFVGMLDPAVKQIIQKFGPKDAINPGDVFIANDPYDGGVSHANDVVLAMPVFVDGQLVAWTANKGHWVDIGGMAPGSLSPDAVELFQEGLILPPVKLFDQDAQMAAVFDIIAANSRMPDQAMGDLWAGIAALRVGRNRIVDLAEKYSIETLIYAIEQYLDYGEKVALAGLRKIPNGVVEASDLMDDGLRINVVLTITDSEFIVDLRDNPDQLLGPINATAHTTRVSAQAVFKAITAPDKWANAGSFRPLKVLTRRGSLFDAIRPSAMGLYYENKIRSTDLIWKALSKHMPDIVPSGHFSSICGTLIKSVSEDGNEKTFIEPEVGGWGATVDGDGNSAQFSVSHGNTFNCPTEVNEARNGVTVDCYKLSSSAAGAGRYCGGRGIELRYRISEKEARLTGGYTRTDTPVWGVCNGHSGGVNSLEILRKNGRAELVNNASNIKLDHGDVVKITTANGGGYGDPADRPISEIYRDYKNGLVKLSEIETIYGVARDVIEDFGASRNP